MHRCVLSIQSSIALIGMYIAITITNSLWSFHTNLLLTACHTALSKVVSWSGTATLGLLKSGISPELNSTQLFTQGFI